MTVHHAFVPTYMGFHGAVRDFFQDFAAPFWRLIHQAQSGMSVFEPRNLPLADQVYIFTNAALIAGKFSSAMHNAVFAGWSARIGVLNRINNIQEYIARTCKHHLVQILAATEDINLLPNETSYSFSISVTSFGLAVDMASRL